MPPTPVKHASLASFLLLAFLSGFGLWYLPARYGLITDAGASANASLRLSPVWDIGDLSAVRMLFENTKRYQSDTEEGAKEWESVVPKDKGILRCLNILRLELMILCRSDLYVENVRDPIGPHAVNVEHVKTCKDWRMVHTAEAQRLFQSFGDD
ncbi:hypothetical protein SCHPADRAFT_938888 [Schizopora paradoxa]|uniref:Uncharacterized protein n=1 Tax=Schizopora paradoxa TaxID=27342 RepID=A0A0H2S082_9AGAM|nr:hypothetical protein SCHPADRAFT_938888 [Schizopora paradoxa]